jgi:nitrate reductase NapE component
VQRRALGLLFLLLAVALLVVAAAALAGAHGAARWVIAFAALALAAWLGSSALSILRK